MKRNLRLSALVVIYLLAVQFKLKAQAPAQLNYQAVVRNTSGQVVASTSVSLRFTIHNDSATGTTVFTEIIPTTTNAFGLANVQIGSVGNLNAVSWSSGSKFLQVDADINNTGYITMGTSQLISVPYALFAANSAPGPIGATGLQGTAGVTGAQGAVGATGVQGNAGAVGATGAQGVPGITGAGGATGVDGAQGATGLQGNVGAQGPTGTQGNQGSAGPTGIDGAQGVTGAPGPSGVAGAQGITGAQGVIGNTGAQGVGVASVTDNGNGTATVLLTNGNSSVITLPAGQPGNAGAQGPTGVDGGGLPAGAITYFAAATVPAGYLECNGQAVSRTTYATLFAFVGTIYGGGDGSTTFNVPDLRGEFVRGYDDSRGVDAGRQIGSFQDATGLGTQVHQTVEVYYDNNDGALYGPFTTNSSGGYAGTTRSISFFKVRPRNVALMPCIKY